MSGHSKWSNTKYRKAYKDSKREKIFNKIVREIYSAIKFGGIDPTKNYKLRSIIEKSSLYNMPKSNVLKIISKFKKNSLKKEFFIEGYGPEGIAILIFCICSNFSIVLSKIKKVFSKFNGNVSKNNSVSHIFKEMGVFLVYSKLLKQKMIEKMIEIGIEDIFNIKNFTVLYVLKTYFEKISFFLEKKNTKIIYKKVLMIPKNRIEICSNKKEKVLKFINELKSMGEVSKVYHNMNKITILKN
ncbi:YebC/PmpR family DNA-binding transcriptional regulator [bacterium endosymbiont of Pedicinus badii]|uniref:YebC/PmpR family DNA-binding transcriptional regulator n=1 Tax=bacterium endosymbiont of Pedicinus badii TaxID=1719126 RepID=UPI0009BB155F|nr:YebC/PmpR family DNA-binding transcriptional regulator [bacterium endosymbiont of Pedicinus badii]OQM34431.1 hypothetical protein AOQ89_00890 [bacterium endosymbiont of Pedicinus badii]